MKIDEISVPRDSLFYSFFYLYNFVPNKYYVGELGHTWSLALEEQYYLLWPFVIYFFNKNKVLLFIFTITLICSISVFIYPKFSFFSEYNYIRWFIPAVAPIMIGSFFAMLINKHETIYSIHFYKKIKFIFIGFILYLFPLYTPMLKVSFIFQSIGVSLILIWILYNQESKLTYILNNKILSYIGKISYGIYVYQGLFLRTGPSGELWIQQFPQNIILTFLTAIISFHFLEKPILKLKRRYNRNT